MVSRCVPENSYFLKELDGEEFGRAFNGKYFKRYYPVFGLIHRAFGRFAHLYSRCRVHRLEMADTEGMALRTKSRDVQPTQSALP